MTGRNEIEHNSIILICLLKSNKTSYPVMAKLPPINFPRKNHISTYIPPTDTSPDHTSVDQAARSLPSTSNITKQYHHPKPKSTCRLTTREEAVPCQVEVEYPASEETTTRYCGGQTRTLPHMKIKMLQKQTYGKQVGTSTRNQRQNSTSTATRNLVAPPKPSEFSGNAWMQSGYVPTILEPRERATLSAGNKRLLRRRQDANGPRFPPSFIGVATDEITGSPSFEIVIENRFVLT